MVNNVLYPLSLHDALPICASLGEHPNCALIKLDGNERHVEINGISIGRGTIKIKSIHVDGLCILMHHALPILRSEEHTSELQSRFDLVCRLLLEKKNPILKGCTWDYRDINMDNIDTIEIINDPTNPDILIEIEHVITDGNLIINDEYKSDKIGRW